MKNTSYYIQYQQETNKPTKAETMRNILRFVCELVGGIAIFAMMYILMCITSVF